MPIFIQPNLTPVMAALSAQQQALTEEINAQKQTLTSAINAQQQVLTVAISEQQQALSAAIESNEQAVAGELLTTKQQLLASAESTVAAVNDVKNKSVIKSIQRGISDLWGTTNRTITISSVNVSKSFVNISSFNSTGDSGTASNVVVRASTVLARLSSSNQLILERGTTAPNVTSWEVIEYE